jgi:glucose-1-phosphate thymidylyltransferase
LIEHKENYRLGVPYFDEQGKLLKVVEKPEKPPNHYGVPGLYFFNQHVFEAFEGESAIKPSARGELEITELYSFLIDHNYRVETAEVEGRWLDPGKFTDMLDANAYLLDLNTQTQVEGEVDKNSRLTGKVRVGADTRIVNSTIIGPVDIGPACLIQDSTIGPSVAIQANCKLEGTRVENSVLMADSTMININRQIRDSYIGKNTEIWEEKQDSVSLFIGDHCQVRLT